MEIESELTKGQKTQRKIIRCYQGVINEMGVEAIYLSKMRFYSKVAEQCDLSESHVRQTLSKYFNGKL